MSLSINLSLSAGYYRYELPAHSTHPEAQTSSHSTKESRHRPSLVKALPQRQSLHMPQVHSRPTTRLADDSKPSTVDTRYTSLSQQAQKMQQEARSEVKKRLEQAADAESLRQLEAATADISRERQISKARMLAADKHSRLSIATATSVKEAKRSAAIEIRQPFSVEMTNRWADDQAALLGWSMVTTPSSAALIRDQEPAAAKQTPPVKGIMSPHTPQSRIGFYMQKDGPSSDSQSDSPNAPRSDAINGSSTNVATDAAAVIPEQSRVGVEERPILVRRLNKYDYLTDPFGSQLIESEAEKEFRLKKSSKWYNRKDVESLHMLFDTLADKDEQEREKSSESDESSIVDVASPCQRVSLPTLGWDKWSGLRQKLFASPQRDTKSSAIMNGSVMDLKASRSAEGSSGNYENRKASAIPRTAKSNPEEAGQSATAADEKARGLQDMKQSAVMQDDEWELV